MTSNRLSVARGAQADQFRVSALNDDGCHSVEPGHFLDTAYGSAREVDYQLSLTFRLGFLPEQPHRELSALSVETSKVLNGLLRSLRKQPPAYCLL